MIRKLSQFDRHKKSMVVNMWRVGTIILLLFNSCSIGWTHLESGRYKKRTSARPFNALPLKAQALIKHSIEFEKYHNAFSCDSNYVVQNYFVVSADYQGLLLRRMGHYIKLSGKKYFLKYKKGEPIVVCDGILYYTASLNLGKGINSKDNWLDNEIFFCIRLKSNQ